MFEKKKQDEASSSQAAPDLSALSASAPAPREKAGDIAKTFLPPAALTPEVISFLNEALRASVVEAVKGLGPVLVQMEELRRQPSESERTAKAREERMAALMHTEENENRANLERLRRKCPHAYVNGAPAINLIHNRPDRQVAGICVICQEFINPREWQIGAPDAQNPRGKPFIREQHKDYFRVLQIEASKT